jgi:dienelactone hydrolase
VVQTTNQIEHYIDHKREELGSNLHELEHKISAATDWRHHFQKNPMTLIGVAFGGGVILASLLGGPQRRGSAPTGARTTPNPTRAHALDTWDHIKSALIGVAAARFTEYVDEVVPGFREQLEKTEVKV